VADAGERSEVDIGPVADVPTDRCIDVAGRAVAVRVGDEVVAYQPFCLHQQSSLAGGMVVAGPKLQCPLHFWRYHLPSGVHTGGRGALTTYPVRVEDGHAIVSLPPPEPPMSLRERLLAHAKEWDRDAARPDAVAEDQPRGGGCLEERPRS
jgi:nitrite reductase/ring-hydroxylating ferredoxin subunit